MNQLSLEMLETVWMDWSVSLPVAFKQMPQAAPTG